MRFVFLFILLHTLSLAQTKKPDSVFCDCKKARVVEVAGTKRTPKTLPPRGPGHILEISNLSHDSKISFEKEHNSAWYKLLIRQTGALVFDLVPSDPKDDYDFMLYKAKSEFFCDSMLDFKFVPLRSCITKNKKDTSGRTGLDYDSKLDYVFKENTPAYAKAVPVKPGEVYYLVVDNVSEHGDGHYLQFRTTSSMLIEGTVKDENGEPVVAEITLTDAKGTVIEEETSKKDGNYSIHAHLVKSVEYSINFYQDHSLTYTKAFTIKDSIALKALNTVLPKLKKGLKYSVGTINFVGNAVQTLPQAVPAMKNLARLMKKNPQLRILIIGHMNGPDPYHSKEWAIGFTKGRATTVKDFLVSNGIDASRIEIDGKGDSEMLFPGTMNESEAVQNRRVEIMVLDY